MKNNTRETAKTRLGPLASRNTHNLQNTKNTNNLQNTKNRSSSGSSRNSRHASSVSKTNNTGITTNTSIAGIADSTWNTSNSWQERDVSEARQNLSNQLRMHDWCLEQRNKPSFGPPPGAATEVTGIFFCVFSL